MNIFEKLLNSICPPNVQYKVLSSLTFFQIWLSEISGNPFGTL